MSGKRMQKGHFLTLVAKDTVVKQFGPGIQHWPDNNFWAMVSSVKSTITDDHLPGLMKRYKIAELYEVHP